MPTIVLDCVQLQADSLQATRPFYYCVKQKRENGSSNGDHFKQAYN